MYNAIAFYFFVKNWGLLYHTINLLWTYCWLSVENKLLLVINQLTINGIPNWLD